jgi:hypothetical protein
MKVPPQSTLGLASIIARSLIVGLVYALASLLVSVLLGSIGRVAPSTDNFLIWIFTGTIVCLSLSPIILHSTWPRSKTIFAVWAVLALVRSLGLGIEGFLFKPTSASGAVAGAIFGLFVSLLVAWLCVLLVMPAGQREDEYRQSGRRLRGWVWRVLLVGFAYFLFYFVFGATNALLYTLSFYKDNPQYGLSLPAPGVIFMAQSIRGPLFGLGSLFIVRAASASRRALALWTGLLLFVVGGAAPYIETTFRSMPLGFNLATLTEVFLQNFLTGVVAVYLYRSRSTAERSA